MSTCVVCSRPMPDTAYACAAESAKAAEQLRAIIELTPDARLVAAGLVRRGQGGSSGKPGSRPPLNDVATDALQAIQNALTTLARDIAETRGAQFVSTTFSGRGVPDPLAEAASWLSGQLEWLRHAIDDQYGPYAPAAFAEIAQCAGRMRGLVNGREPGRYAGPCSALVDDPDAPCPVNCACHNGPDYACDEPGGCGSAGCGLRECGHDVESRPGANVAACRACGAEYDVDEQQAWMRREIEGHLARPVEIAGVLLRLGVPVGYSTIAAYAAKGQLVPHGHDQNGKPLYRIGDVLDLRMAATTKTSRRRLPPPRDMANPAGG